MRHNRTPLGFLSVLAIGGLAGCGVTEADLTASRQQIVDWYNGQVAPQLQAIAGAVCNLEVHTSAPNPAATPRICPNGPGGPGDKTSPPPPPPPFP